MMFVSAAVVILSIFLWIYLSNILKPCDKHGTDINSFDKYIEDTHEIGETGYDTNKVQDVQDKYCPLYTEPGRQILILYGTEYGFSEEVAKLLFGRLLQVSEEHVLKLQPRLLNANSHHHLRLEQEQLVLVAIATSGDGVPPSSAVEWFNSFTSTNSDLTHLTFSVLALGDSNYPHFCRTGRSVFKKCVELGAVPLTPRRDVDMEDWSIINGWMDDVLQYLEINYSILEERLDYLSPLLVSSQADTGFSRLRPFIATLKIKEQLTIQDHPGDKETIHCELCIEGSRLIYESGDAVGIYPVNREEDVDWVLAAGGFHGDCPGIIPSSAYQQYLSQPEDDLTQSQCLLKHYDLKNVRVSLLELLMKNAQGQALERLEDILRDGTSRVNKKLMHYLEEVEVGDVLEDFQTSIPLEEFLSSLRPLQPRYYSISSSPEQDPNNISVTAAVIRYSSRGRSRVGVATTFLQDRLCIGDLCPVFISPNTDFRLPREGSVDVIMIGPGTGIAPFRAFIQERVITGAKGRNLLYFGCRHRDKDFLYRTELERWVDNQDLILRTAFSRDGERKEYVQHLIKQDQQLVWTWIQGGAHVYVCGDARTMAGDVHQTLLSVAMEAGHMTHDEALQYIEGLEESHRYQKDVWVS